MKVISFANQKGGVGKTTTTYHIARSLVRMGKTVLVIDLDEQANMTDSLADEEYKGKFDVTVADVLSPDKHTPILDASVASIWDDVYVVPSGRSKMPIVTKELVDAIAGESALRGAIEKVSGKIDIVLIDCPPRIDKITVNALTASDAVVYVSEAAMYSASGLNSLHVAVEAIKKSYNPTLRVAGVVINRHKARTTLAQEWQNAINEYSNENKIALLSVIPDRIVISEATSEYAGLDQYVGMQELVTLYDDIAKKLVKE
jgi:chromosome partitioning protein